MIIKKQKVFPIVYDIKSKNIIADLNNINSLKEKQINKFILEKCCNIKEEK